MRRKLLLVLVLLAPLGLYPFLRGTETPGPVGDPMPHVEPPLTPDQRQALACVAIFPGQAFPGGIPWESLRAVGAQESKVLQDLADHDPVEFLQRGLERYQKDVTGYRCIFDKQERVNGKLRQKERLRVHFSEQGFRVHMEWLEGRDRFGAIRTLYVREDDEDVLMVRAVLEISPIMTKALTDPQVKSTSRFPISEFGMYKGAASTVKSMRAAQEKGTLHVKYHGVEPVKEVGNRLCHKFIRTPYYPPEEDDCNELVIYIDVQTLMQVGSILKDSKGDLIAYYYFHSIELNPTFHEHQFTRKKL